MPKKIISDMIVTKKSIRQIPINTRKKLPPLPEAEENMDQDDEIIVKPRAKKATSWQRKPVNPKFAIWLIAIICLLALFFGVSILFSSATIIITPKVEKINFSNETFTAKSDARDSASLVFEVLNIKQTGSETVSATEEKEVAQKASGKIIIYNNYSTVPQRLINNTRFEANNGKIYRINSSVIVPGLKKNGNQVIPGSIEATVFADQAGDTYNLKLSDLAGDFKIPGFKGDPRYTAFYGRLKTDITGGFQGKQRIVGAEIRKSAEDAIKTKLKEQLLNELYAVKPENYLIFKDGYNIDYTSLADTAVDSDKAQINIEGNLNAVVFNNLKLSKYFAENKIKDFDGLPVEFILNDELVTSLSGKDTTGLWKNSALSLKINGEVTIKWLYDADTIKKELAGKKEADVRSVLLNNKDSVIGLQVLFKPVWTRYFPDNLDKIKVIEAII
jgi:hypothetical protein